MHNDMNEMKASLEFINGMYEEQRQVNKVMGDMIEETRIENKKLKEEISLVQAKIMEMEAERLFRPKADLPQELNDFLTDVQDHKKDFAFIRNVAKNRRKYEKSYAENQELFAEDLDNQLTIAPYYNRRFNNLDNQNSQIQDFQPYVYNPLERPSRYDRESNFRTYYPNERYSKFIHSPIRLRRELEPSYLDTHIDIKPNSRYGEIQRPEPKFPRNRYADDENKYHTGFVVGMDEDEDNNDEDDYAALRAYGKKKREVEISIKSDGKLVKQIEENENGPKSIILNIKASNSNIKSQVPGNLISQTNEKNNEPNNAGALGSNSSQPTQINKTLDGPSNSKTIPNLANTMSNPNEAQNKNIGVPINSMPTSNKNDQSAMSQKYEANNAIISKNVNEAMKSEDRSPNMQNYNLPEVSRVSNQKIDSYNAKMLNGYNRQLENNFENSRWTGDNNQMAKSIDIAQNNGNDFGRNKPNLNTNLEEPNRESDFERVQGLVMDNTSMNGNINKNKLNIYKRGSLKEKRWDDIDAYSDKVDLPLYVEDGGADVTVDGGLEALEQEANDLNNTASNQQNPVHWDKGDSEILNLNPNQPYEIIEKSTKHIMIVPLEETTTECIIDIHIPEKTDTSEEKKEEAKIIGDAIAQAIEKENTSEATEEDEEATTECGSERETPKQEETKIEIITHEEVKENEHKPGKDHNEKVKKIEILRTGPEKNEHRGHENHGFHERKRQSGKNQQIGKYIFHRRRGYGPPESRSSNKFKREEGNSHSDEDAIRNRKHLPSLPKYKRKRVRQHHKKRVNRVDEPSFVDYYDFSKYYGDPQDTFDFIPSYYRRQLKSVNYEFDPYLISDVGQHEQEEIKKFEEAQEANTKNKHVNSKVQPHDKKSQNTQGSRKKFKSEGDYSDEEDPLFKSIPKKVFVKKTENELAPNTDRTTEENDDDYNYQDLSDSENEEEDVAYEEIPADSNNLEVEEPIASNSSNKSEHENDRLNLKEQNEYYIKISDIVTKVATEQPTEMSFSSIKEVAVKLAKGVLSGKTLQFPEEAIAEDDMESFKKENNNEETLEQDETEASNDEEVKDNEDIARARGHGHQKKKKKKGNKTKPKRDDEFERLAINEDEGIEDMSDFHGRGNLKMAKHTQVKPRIKNDGSEIQNEKGPITDKKPQHFEEAIPLTNQQKQDIFLKYNPEFQRWPRFVQSDSKYRELMRKRSLENRNRYFRNPHSMNRFPISNEYFLSPQRPEFVKREEPSTQVSTAKIETPAATVVSSQATEGSKATTAGDSTTAEHKDPVSDSSANDRSGPASLDAQESLNEATLPQAAKNILQTANSDIFENTTVPSLEGTEAGNNSVSSGDNQTNIEESTLFQFTSNADDLTPNTQCGVSNSKANKDLTPCPDELATHGPINISSVLPLVPDSATSMMMNISKDEYLDLNEIVGGTLPKQIVSQSLSNARGGVRQGLNSGKFNMNLPVSNINSSAETKMILDEMTSLMMKLKYHSTCQVLPVNLKTYMKLITKNEMDDPMAKVKEMQEIDFDEHQSSYVFHSGESDSIQGKAQILKELLNKFNNLPASCKERAEPVKEYIESHLAMIDNMSGKGFSKQSTIAAASEEITTVHTKAKKEIISNSGNNQEKDLDSQMMEEGLNNQHADANEAIENKNKKDKREAADSRFQLLYGNELSTSTSPQYGKLAEAVRKMRHRRESIKRISQIYGRDKREDHPFRKDEKGFESPLVINF